MARTATLTPGARPPVGRAPSESGGWWLGLVGPIVIGLTVAAVCGLSAISF